MIIGHYEHDIWAKGGIASYIRQLGAAQHSVGHTVHYLSLKSVASENSDTLPIVVRDDTDLFLQAQKLGLDILHLHTFIDTPPPSNIPAIRTLHVHHPYCPSGGRYLERWHCPCDRSYSLQGCLWGHLVDHCGSVRPQEMLKNFQQTWHEKTILPQIPVITVSQFLKDQMVRSGYSESSIRVLPLFVNLAPQYSPPPQTGVARFVFLGRIVPQKGLSFLLQALRKVKVPFHLDIAGEGYQEPELCQSIEKFGLGDRVTFYGWVSPDKASHLIESARAIIFPSMWHEPAGFITLEAATMGRAVIGTQVGAIPEYTNRLQNSLLVEPGNTSQLADAITRLVEDWSLAQQLGETGRNMLNHHFKLQDHLDQLTQFYNSAICLNKSTYLS